jgi:hypothetical protein
MIRRFYYNFWADAIFYYNSEKFQYDWKFYSLLHTTVAISLFLMFLSVFLVPNDFFGLLLEIDLMPGSKIEGGIIGFLVFGAVPLFINYFLIFHNNKHELIVNKYTHSNGKLVKIVLYSMLLLPFLFLLFSFFIEFITLR